MLKEYYDFIFYIIKNKVTKQSGGFIIEYYRFNLDRTSDIRTIRNLIFKKENKVLFKKLNEFTLRPRKMFVTNFRPVTLL